MGQGRACSFSCSEQRTRGLERLPVNSQLRARRDFATEVVERSHHNVTQPLVRHLAVELEQDRGRILSRYG